MDEKKREHEIEDGRIVPMRQYMVKLSTREITYIFMGLANVATTGRVEMLRDIRKLSKKLISFLKEK